MLYTSKGGGLHDFEDVDVYDGQEWLHKNNIAALMLR